MLYLCGGFYDQKFETPSNSLSVLTLVDDNSSPLMSASSMQEMCQPNQRPFQKIKSKFKLTEKKDIVDRSWLHLYVGDTLSNNFYYKCLISQGKLVMISLLICLVHFGRRYQWTTFDTTLGNRYW
jgi:hypothetical protein